MEVIIIIRGGNWSCVTLFLHFIVLHFLPLFVTTSSGGVETYCLQIVVANAGCSLHCRNTVAAGVGLVTDVGVILQTLVGSASLISLL